jgi:hypothetical protein
MTNVIFKLRKDLEYLAKWFSNNYKKLDLDVYIGDNYSLQYVDKIVTDEEGFEKGIITSCRVDGLEDFGFIAMEFNKSFFMQESITKNFAFYMVIWCAIVFEIGGDYLEADTQALNYYKNTGRPLIDVKIGMIETFKLYESDENIKRFKANFENL